MSRCIGLLITALIAACIPSAAARMVAVPVTHAETPVYQVYAGSSLGTNQACVGYAGYGGDPITAVPGVLSIVSGDKWSNFVPAAAAGIPYGIKNVVLTKRVPNIIQCADVFTAQTLSQQGNLNIRRWWPLMYEVPGTTWTLTILYGTSVAWDDDGPGPNPIGYVHSEVWTWRVEATFDTMKLALRLFHQLPFGRDEVPLISDEQVPRVLESMLDAVVALHATGDTVSASLLLGDFEMRVMDECIAVSPEFPNPTGPATGIANSLENPACCKILADAEYVGFDLGILQPGK